MPSEARFGVQTALRLKSPKLKATGIYPEKQKTQEFIGKNNNLSTVIPTKVGILIRPHGNLYSGLNLNQYGVASPCRTICTVCGFVALS